MVQSISVVPVASRTQLRRFVKLPRRLYRDMQGYVPPLDLQQMDVYDGRKNPFFEHAEVQLWVAERGGETVGRIAAQIDALHNDAGGAGEGYFGGLCAVDDREVVHALTGTAQDWLSARGMTRVVGPFNLSINQECGMLVAGHRERNTLMMPWDPPYLPGHMDALGYAKATDMFAYDIDLAAQPTSHSERLLARLESSHTVRLARGDLSDLHKLALTLLDIFNDSWSENWGFVPMTEAEIVGAAHQLKPILVEDCLSVVELDGRDVAFALALPNLHEWTGDLDGRLLPFGWTKLARRYLGKRISSARVLMMGVRSEVKNSPVGAAVAMLMIESLWKGAGRWGVRHVELGWVLEDNRAMRRILELIGARPYKTYRIYGLDL